MKIYFFQSKIRVKLNMFYLTLASDENFRSI